jgi:transcriptional regulator with XRE-family HTH domain
MRGEGTLLSRESIRDYFQGLVAEARANQRVRVGDRPVVYLVDLLAAFADAGRLWSRDEDGPAYLEPLALVLARAIEAGGEGRARELRRLGDLSLYLAGFFADHLERRLGDLRYTMQMGHLAYSTLARLEGGRRGPPRASLFAELADQFASLVDVLNEVSERLALSSQQGVLRLYERYLRTGSVRLARLLAAQGVAPVPRPGGVQ